MRNNLDELYLEIDYIKDLFYSYVKINQYDENNAGRQEKQMPDIMQEGDTIYPRNIHRQHLDERFNYFINNILSENSRDDEELAQLKEVLSYDLIKSSVKITDLETMFRDFINQLLELKMSKDSFELSKSLKNAGDRHLQSEWKLIENYLIDNKVFKLNKIYDLSGKIREKLGMNKTGRHNERRVTMEGKENEQMSDQELGCRIIELKEEVGAAKDALLRQISCQATKVDDTSNAAFLVKFLNTMDILKYKRRQEKIGRFNANER